jgi:xanthine dehydrogenase large subunit
VEVEVGRLGGGFGGKEDQATAWAALAALGAMHSGRAVKLVLSRHDDMRMTGKRHPYSSDYTIGIDEQGLILAFTADFYQNAGASADLSPAVLARTLFHATNSYFIPNVQLTGYSCRTHLPPNTAFRGFGGPQGMFVIEAALRHIAEVAGIDPTEMQRLNLINDDRTFPYGQHAAGAQAVRCWEQCATLYDTSGVRKRINQFNSKHKRYKKGMAIMPICFGISFTNTPMNQAGALVHIYLDGSVGISTAAIEMGQGVSTKIVQVAAQTLGISPRRMRIFPSSTRTIANTSPTAASAAADLNGKATEIACTKIRERLLQVSAEHLCIAETSDLAIANDEVYLLNQKTGLGWQDLIEAAYLKRYSLSEHGYYATPEIYFDEKSGTGRPFAYHVYGSALCQVSVDTLLGTYQIDAVEIVHDGGTSMNRDIDLGQIEGALAQGIGWMTVEEVLFNENGKPLTDTLSTYKIPDIYHGPQNINVAFLDNSAHPLAIFNSKAVGEPPLMYGLGVFFALRDALRAARPGSFQPFVAPLTPERVLMQLHRK